MWVYKQSSGVIMWNREHVGVGYSGFREGKNNPAKQAEHGIGPIPRGLWVMGRALDLQDLGPLAIPLFPVIGTQHFGRSGFYWHGDSAEHPGEASHGCIVSARAIRERANASVDKQMLVVE
jgi:hypothetical protein